MSPMAMPKVEWEEDQAVEVSETSVDSQNGIYSKSIMETAYYYTKSVQS